MGRHISVTIAQLNSAQKDRRAMTFEPGDRVRLRARTHQEMTVKVVSEGYVLCEAWAGSEIIVGGWPAEALEPVEHGLLIRRVSEGRGGARLAPLMPSTKRRRSCAATFAPGEVSRRRLETLDRRPRRFAVPARPCRLAEAGRDRRQRRGIRGASPRPLLAVRLLSRYDSARRRGSRRCRRYARRARFLLRFRTGAMIG